MKCVICDTQMTHLVQDLHTCSCGLVSSDIKPDKSIYDKSYVLKYQRYEKTDIGKQIQRLRYETVHKHVEKGTLLDFGCGVGSFVNYCSINGLNASGFDINPYGDYCEPTALMRKYDIVTFWDSLEHVEDPVKLIKSLDSKYIFICTPDTDGFDYRDITKWKHYMPEEHCHYYTLNSLCKLLDKCGYEVIDHNWNESKYRTGGGDKNIITIGGVRGTHKETVSSRPTAFQDSHT